MDNGRVVVYTDGTDGRTAAALGAAAVVVAKAAAAATAAACCAGNTADDPASCGGDLTSGLERSMLDASERLSSECGQCSSNKNEWCCVPSRSSSKSKLQAPAALESSLIVPGVVFAAAVMAAETADEPAKLAKR
mmetsp:Transcript_71530/g.143999  ORF Transcript_71530/g.143999 Transcript_71530/m.143999 type:complete len:135 (-) Transcript_71530:598-1002(-)